VQDKAEIFDQMLACRYKYFSVIMAATIFKEILMIYGFKFMELTLSQWLPDAGSRDESIRTCI
jgi:hypothetical protein